jgi:hypothetical protein
MGRNKAFSFGPKCTRQKSKQNARRDPATVPRKIRCNESLVARNKFAMQASFALLSLETRRETRVEVTTRWKRG